jgi:ADP-heptose:LPS heptosyltransferase
MTVSPPLVVRFGALGDTVLITPLLRLLAKLYGCPCDVMGGVWVKHLFLGTSQAGRLCCIASPRRPYFLAPDQWSAARWLRARGRGPVFLLDTMPKIRRLLRYGGVTDSEIIARDDFGRAQGMHVVDRNLRLAERASAATHSLPQEIERGTYLEVPESDRFACSKWLSTLGITTAPIVVQPGNSRTMKGKAPNHKKFWPLERWVELLRQLLDRNSKLQILVTGSPTEAGLTEQLANGCRDRRVLSVARDMGVRRLMALLKQARACISVDSGPAHVAAAVGCPLIVLFGGVWPRLMAPVSMGSPVKLVSGRPFAAQVESEAAWISSHSMLDISVEDVWEAACPLVGE